MKMFSSIVWITILSAGCGGKTESSSAAPESFESIRAEAGSAISHDERPIEDLGTRSRGSDWPSFLGPNRDSRSTETGIITDWNETRPRLVWEAEVGSGYGIGSVARGRFYQFDRVRNRARLRCLNSETGELLWTYEYSTDYEDAYGYDGGPRSSPVVDGNRVYIYGADGMLVCLLAGSGDVVWKLDTLAKFGVVQNFFGVGSTPVIEGDLLIAIVGGSPRDQRGFGTSQLDRVAGNGSGIVALDKLTGQVRYTLSDELSSYASPLVVDIDGNRYGLAFMRGGLVGFQPTEGKLKFHFPWRAKILESVNASTPVVVGTQVFISETYGPGSALLDLKGDTYDVVWKDEQRSRVRAMQTHWNTPIYVDGYLYGCTGRNEGDAALRCIKWDSGRVMWTRPTRERSSLLHVDGHFVCLGEYGNLMLIKPNPEMCEIVATRLRQQSSAPLPLKAPCWSAPILSHGLLYLRGKDRLVCLELIEM